MSPSLTFRTGVRDVLPTVFGYIGVGLAFGIVAHTSHLSLLVVAGLSFVVYAGSAQFIITSMLLLHDPLSAIFISTFLVNSRMILMSTSLAQYFKHESLTRNLLIGTLVTDETFALAMNKQNKTNGKHRRHGATCRFAPRNTRPSAPRLPACQRCSPGSTAKSRGA